MKPKNYNRKFIFQTGLHGSSLQMKQIMIFTSFVRVGVSQNSISPQRAIDYPADFSVPSFPTNHVVCGIPLISHKMGNPQEIGIGKTRPVQV
jgi:hypothetical protein